MSDSFDIQFALTFFMYLSSQSQAIPSPAVSLHLSDSISQVLPGSGSQISVSRGCAASHVSLLPSLQTQPAIRPSQYPFEVLWNLEDCQHDVDVNIQDSNKSRPSMDRAIRHQDGTMVTNMEWSAIKASARRIANELAGLPDPTNRQARMRRTKMFYRTYHARAWTHAISRLEDEQPLLKLCSSNWKADHTLGNSIQAILSKQMYASKRNKQKKGKGKEKSKRSDVDNDDSNNSDYGRGGDDRASCKFFLLS